MKFSKKIKIKSNKNRVLSVKFYEVAMGGLLALSCTSAMALDTSFSLHKGDESKTKGISVGVANNFTKGSNWYWSVAYNTLDDVQVKWNNDELYFKTDTIDALISYRQPLKSYNEFFKKITIEYQIGASVALTENKFFWQDLNEEKYFSEQGDINAVLAVAAHYNFNKKTALTLGVKYQPNFSEFGDVSSVFIGINYKFGKVVGY
tara:strand:+ start:187 stop:801 length:615 start_codon:yes stop_codon:yes gene_type:complete